MRIPRKLLLGALGWAIASSPLHAEEIDQNADQDDD